MTREEARRRCVEERGYNQEEHQNMIENIIDVTLYLEEHGQLNEMMPEVEGLWETRTMFIYIIETLQIMEENFSKRGQMPRIKDIEKFVNYVRGDVKERYNAIVNQDLLSSCHHTVDKVANDLWRILKQDKEEKPKTRKKCQ